MYFSDLLLKLQEFWKNKGCNIVMPYDFPSGAGTFHPATLLRSLEDREWNVAYVAPSRRPTDGRYGENPNRLGSYYQFQVIMKPSPDNIQEIYLESLEYLGLNLKEHDIRFVEDIGNHQLLEHGDLVGRYGLMVWKLLNLLIFNKWED